MINETEYQNNKQMIEWLRQKCAEAEGCFNQSMRTLKKEFKCKTLDEAKELLKELEAQCAEHEEAYRDFIKQTKRKYKKQLRAYHAERKGT